ncbi:ABC1 kinase family protein [Mesobacillus subterraneus]|uniref:ABC transporter n=1 Tax=Mesobacillus subterraneus TaxID=285983 RepID=A0A0D6ZFV0_9BACI|nr:AarF/ABC1/UbiB kinase family protein [Mesobacillus subterraneus]KIY23483.1 ABC transporter [Mesobacillus subterraneus]
MEGVSPIFEKRIRHFQRYRDIVAAFSRNGFGFLIKELGLLELLSLPKRLFVEDYPEIHSKTLGERIRLFLEELGPTFVKIGQIASTRPDLIPADIIHELEKLQDRVPPFSFQEVKTIIEQELGVAIDSVFEEFHESPLAAASIGQVHFAVLNSGERVAVKIQRPNIKKIIETDLEILQELALLAELRLKWAAQYQLRDMVEEFSMSLRAELNYTIEGRNAEKIDKQFENDPKIRIPKVYWNYSTPKVLTMEYIEGKKLNEIQKNEDEEYNHKILAERLVHAIFHQILIEGFFHGDPHPGNIIALPGEVIVFMDFGMVGRLTTELKSHFASLVISMMRQNTDGVIKAITRMGLVPDDVNMQRLRSDVDQLKEKYYDVPLSQVSLGEAVNDLFSIAYQHHIQIPADLILLGKTLLTIEGTVEQLDPELSIIKMAEPFGRQLLKERYHPRKVAGKVLNHMFEYAEILTELPKSIQQYTTVLKKGKMRMEITIPELDLFLTKLDRISNRLSFSIVLLAFSIIMVGLIIGSALSRQSLLLWNIPAIEIGFGVALLMFLWLLYSIFKSGKF